jgi:hypothetical protein
MPKRKAKRPVGREISKPKAPKKRGRPKKQQKPGARLQWTDCDIRGLFELPEISQEFALSDPEVPGLERLIEIIEQERKTALQGALLYDRKHQAGNYPEWIATLYAWRMKQFLRAIQEKVTDQDDNFRDIISMAIELGRLSVAIQVVTKAPVYNLGKKFKETKPRKEPRPKEELKAALDAEMKRHGKIVRARENVAKKFKVGPKLIAEWQDLYNIEFE